MPYRRCVLISRPAASRRIALPCAAAVAGGLFLYATSTRAESCAEDPLPARCRSDSFSAVVTTVGDPASLFEPLAVGQTISGTFAFGATVLTDLPSTSRRGRSSRTIID